MTTFKEKLANLSDSIAINSVNYMSTMTCVVLFFIWSIIPLFWDKSTSFVAYISADIIQLVALPMIMLGQRLSDKASKSAVSDFHDRHDDLAESLNELHAVVKAQSEETSAVTELLANQQIIIDQLNKLNKPRK